MASTKHSPGRAARETAQQKKRQERFLGAYIVMGTIHHAAKKVGIGRRTHYFWIETDPAYAEAFKEAQEDATEQLEREARRRAVEGTIKPVFYEGKQVNTRVREYSDTLLIFLLKGLRPDRYRERFEHTGKDGGPIEHADLSKLTTEELQAWRALMAKAQGQGAA